MPSPANARIRSWSRSRRSSSAWARSSAARRSLMSCTMPSPLSGRPASSRITDTVSAHPDDLAGLADVALVDAVAAQLAREHLPRQPEVRVDVVRVGDVGEGEPGELGRAVAGETAEGGVRLGQTEVVADEGHGDGAVLEHALEALARLPQGRLAQRVLAAVADRCHDHCAVRRVERGQRDLGRELAAVTAQRGQLHARPGAAQSKPGTGEAARRRGVRRAPRAVAGIGPPSAR